LQTFFLCGPSCRDYVRFFRQSPYHVYTHPQTKTTGLSLAPVVFYPFLLRFVKVNHYARSGMYVLQGINSPCQPIRSTVCRFFFKKEKNCLREKPVGLEYGKTPENEGTPSLPEKIFKFRVCAFEARTVLGIHCGFVCEPGVLSFAKCGFKATYSRRSLFPASLSNVSTVHPIKGAASLILRTSSSANSILFMFTPLPVSAFNKVPPSGW